MSGWPTGAKRLLPLNIGFMMRKCQRPRGTAETCLIGLEVAVLGSKAVICRSLVIVQGLIESDRFNYTSYQRQLSQGARVAEDNEFDRVRTQVEAAISDFYRSATLVFRVMGPMQWCSGTK